MPLLFYGRLEDGKRRLYGKNLRPIETSTFDSWKIKHLAPFPDLPYLANFWWFEERKHSAVSWNERRQDVSLPIGIRVNERDRSREQTVFLPGLLSHMDAVEIIRTEFPRYLLPSPIVFRFNNQSRVFLYD